MKYITLIDADIHNAIVIYGKIGKKAYYYYTKNQAIRLYNKECKKELKND